MKTCPLCAEKIQDAAIKCRYCGSMLGEGSSPGDVSARDLALEGELRLLVTAGQKIGAIKVVRERKGLGLLEAKTYVEAVETGADPDVALRSLGGKAAGCTSMLLTLVLSALCK